MSYHALRTHVFVFARPYHTLPTYAFGSVWLVWYITSCILHDNTRAPAYNSWPPVHVTYACKYTQGHPLRSQGPAQKRKDTRIELVVLVHGGRRDVIRPAPHVDLSHTAGALACQISCRACTCGVRVSSRACIQRHGSRPSPRSRSCLNACMRVCLYASAKDLVSAVLLYGLLLVQALERAVMPLVEAPIFLNRDPQESHVLQDRQACLDRPLQD